MKSLFVLLFFIVDLTAAAQDYILLKNGSLKTSDSLEINEDVVKYYTKGNLTKLLLKDVEYVVQNDSIIQISTSANPNFKLEKVFSIKESNNGLCFVGYPTACADSIAKFKSIYFRNKRGASFVSTGISLNSNHYSYFPHLGYYVQYKPKSSSYLFEFNYAQKLIPVSFSLLYRAFKNYATVGIGYQLKSKTILENRLPFYTATFLKVTLGHGYITYADWDIFSDSHTTSSVFSKSVSILWTTVSTKRQSSLEIGIGRSTRLRSILPQNQEVFTILVSLKLGVSEIL